MSVNFKKDYLTFVKGLNTEINFVTDSEELDGYCSDISNFKLEKNGVINKRGGLSIKTTNLNPGLNKTKPNMFLWKNINGLVSDNFYVTQLSDTIIFHDANNDISNETLMPFNIELKQYYSPGYEGYFKVNFYSSEGFLYIYGKYITPLFVEYNKQDNVLIVNELNIKIRDYIGIENPDVTSITQYPKNLSDILKYNLINQGFSEEQILKYQTSNGFLPAQIDNPKLFNFIKKDNEYGYPTDTWDSKYTLESNTGTSKSTLGRNIIDLFNTEYKTEGGKIPFKINTRDILSMYISTGICRVVLKQKRVDKYNVGETFYPKTKQNGFQINIPQNFGDHGESVFGSQTRTPKSPTYIDWNNLKIPVFTNVNSNFIFNDSMSESEYKSYGFKYNNVVQTKDVGDGYLYVLISDSDEMLNNFINELINENVGGVIEYKKELPLSWNLPTNESGTYVRIKTLKSVDNKYYSRITYSKNQPEFLNYEYTKPDGSKEIKSVNTYKLFIELTGSNNTPYSGRIACTYLNDETLEVIFNTSFSLKDNNNIIPSWDNPNRWLDYSFNSVSENGILYMYDIEELFNQIEFDFGNTDSKLVSVYKEKYRPESLTFFANRVFYASLESEKYSNHIFYSQMLNANKANLNVCHTFNDPTSLYNSEVLMTDGGYISLPESNKVIDLVPIKNQLLILCNDSIYKLESSTFFSPTDFNITKICDIGILSKDSYSIIDNNIMFCSNDGIYIFQYNDINSNINKINISNKFIRKIYNSLTYNQKKYIKMKYNKYNKTIYIMYNNIKDIQGDVYNTIMCYDIDLKAFYKYDIDVDLDFQIIDFFDILNYNKNSNLNLLTYNNSNGTYIPVFEDTNVFKDFNKNIYSCHIASNNINYNDIIRNKRVRYLLTYAENIPDSYCKASIEYNNTIVDGFKMSKKQNIFMNQNKTNGDVHTHKQMSVGEGLFFKVRYESDVDKPCKIIGWTIFVEGNNNVFS